MALNFCRSYEFRSKISTVIVEKIHPIAEKRSINHETYITVILLVLLKKTQSLTRARAINLHD